MAIETSRRGAPAQGRKLIGEPKSGLALRIRQTPSVMTLEGRPDPVLLYVVAAAAIGVGAIGSLAASPREGLAGFLTFALLFSPLLGVLVFNALRVKMLCVLDRESGNVHIDERSITHRVQEEYPLHEVESVFVRRLPSAPLAGGTSAYGVFLSLGDADYLAASTINEGTAGQDAWRIARFLGVDLEAPVVDIAEIKRPQAGLLVTTAFLYFIPIILAASALMFLRERLPAIEPSLAGLLGAVVISQIGAIIAFAYYRARRPYES